MRPYKRGAPYSYEEYGDNWLERSRNAEGGPDSALLPPAHLSMRVPVFIAPYAVTLEIWGQRCL